MGLKDVSFFDGSKTLYKKKDVPDALYHGLINSNHLDISLGFFSLSSLKVLAYPFAKFIIENNGYVRIYCNEKFSEQDFNVIKEAHSSEVNYDLGKKFESLLEGSKVDLPESYFIISVEFFSGDSSLKDINLFILRSSSVSNSITLPSTSSSQTFIALLN